MSPRRPPIFVLSSTLFCDVPSRSSCLYKLYHIPLAIPASSSPPTHRSFFGSFCSSAAWSFVVSASTDTHTRYGLRCSSQTASLQDPSPPTHSCYHLKLASSTCSHEVHCLCLEPCLPHPSPGAGLRHPPRTFISANQYLAHFHLTLPSPSIFLDL